MGPPETGASTKDIDDLGGGRRFSAGGDDSLGDFEYGGCFDGAAFHDDFLFGGGG
jgi:hypothetical protein